MSCHTVWDTLSLDNYKTVESIKRQLRKGNWQYLRDHPEIRAIVRVFLHHALSEEPNNIYHFAAKLFDPQNNPLLTTMVNQQLKRVRDMLKNSEWSEFDGDMFFGESESTHSLLSNSSLESSANSMLSYALILREREKED